MSTNLNSEYRIRRAGVNELSKVLHNRRSMFLDMGFEGNTVEEAMAISETMFAEAMNQDRYAGWFVENAMKIMTAWSRQQGFRNLYLHSSKQGRPIYESLGFTPTNEMGRRLDSSQ